MRVFRHGAGVLTMYADGTDGTTDGPQPRGEFTIAWRGYDREDVRRYVRDTAEHIRRLAAERDAALEHAGTLARRLDDAQVHNEKLRARLDRVCRQPVETDGLSERLLHMVDLAQAEAEEIVAKATTLAEETRARLDAEERRWRDERARREADLEARRATLEAEHRELVQRVRDEARQAAERAERRRRELDEAATRRRQTLERELTTALAALRVESERAIGEREQIARTEAERIVADAADQAAAMIAEATARVRELEDVRVRVSRDLRAVRALLADAAPLVDPVPGECAEPVLPVPRDPGVTVRTTP